MNIQDDKLYMVFEKEFNGNKYYKIGISKKGQDGKYQNGYIDIKFAKCEPPKNKEKIYLKNAFLSFYLSKDSHTIPYIVCMGYETAEQTIESSKEQDIVKQDVETDPYEEFGKEHIDDDFELPF